jgi:hypothetical protein
VGAGGEEATGSLEEVGAIEVAGSATSKNSVGAGDLRMVDDEDLQRNSTRFQLQTELFGHCREDRRSR